MAPSDWTMPTMSTCMDCGEPFFDTNSLSCALGASDVPDPQPRDDVWEPCRRSSCTSFSGEVTR
jgi:hypothetical protein